MGDAQFDLFAGRRRRDVGIARTAHANTAWIDDALAVLATAEAGRILTGEDLRRWCVTRGVVPKHPNAWGALIKTAIKRRLIEATGYYAPMEDKRSHARKTPVYRRT